MTSTNLYQYFVAYSHPTGFGHTVVTTTLPISSYDDVLGARDAIINSNGMTGISIINWQLLSGPVNPPEGEALTSLYNALGQVRDRSRERLDADTADPRVAAEHLIDALDEARTAVGHLIGHSS